VFIVSGVETNDVLAGVTYLIVSIYNRKQATLAKYILITISS